MGLASLPWVGGPANIADFMTQVLTQPLEHGELDPETLTSLRDRMSVPRQSGSYRGYEATWEEAVVIHIQQIFATKACDDSLE